MKVGVPGVPLGTLQETQDAMQELASSSAPAGVLTAKPVNGDGKEITVWLEREGRMKSVRKYLVQVSGAGQVSFSAGRGCRGRRWYESEVSESRYDSDCVVFGGALCVERDVEGRIAKSRTEREVMVEGASWWSCPDGLLRSDADRRQARGQNPENLRENPDRKLGLSTSKLLTSMGFL